MSGRVGTVERERTREFTSISLFLFLGASFQLDIIFLDPRTMKRKEIPHHQLAIMSTLCVTFKPNQWKLTASTEGPVTDYGAGIVHWMRHREPRQDSSSVAEAERQSISYVADVSARPRNYDHTGILVDLFVSRCCRPLPKSQLLPTRCQPVTFIRR